MPPRRKRRHAPDLEMNTRPDDTRRTTRPDTQPPHENRRAGHEPARADDTGVSEYERELDRLDAATSTRH